MGAMSFWHWALVILVVILLFGRGKVSDLMGDVAKGIKSFKKGMADDEPVTTSTTPASTPAIDQSAAVKAEADKAKS